MESCLPSTTKLGFLLHLGSSKPEISSPNGPLALPGGGQRTEKEKLTFYGKFMSVLQQGESQFLAPGSPWFLLKQVHGRV